MRTQAEKAALFEELYPIIRDNGMLAAYNRERQLMPILQENEEVGMRIDVQALHNDLPLYREAYNEAEHWLRTKLCAPELNLDADKDVSEVLLSQGIVPEENWQLTESGQLCMKKDVLLPEHFTGPNGATIASVLGYRNRLQTCLNMFMTPWLNQASARDGYVSTNWNQVRGESGGTRTGRGAARLK
jgi:DNA polymerase I-like protein with 3'-5' exonuclease and polymerase domains